MPAEKIIIRFSEKTGFLIPDKPISLENLGLNETVDYFKPNAYWEFRILHHDIDKRKLYAEILSYDCRDIPFSGYQLQQSNLFKNIDIVSFRDIRTEGLLRTAELKRNKSLKPFPDVAHQAQPPKERKIQSDQKEVLKGSFSIPVRELAFQLGGVTCTRTIPGILEPMEFFVENDNIRQEFEAVKNYFIKILDSKKISIHYEISLVNNTIQNIVTWSPEIKRINRESIESVKFEFVNSGFRKKIHGIEDKSLFTMEEAFERATDGKLNPDAFYSDADAFLQDLLQISNTKHFHHLKYLSSLHAHTIMKLRFVLKPLSFIFLVTGNRYDYLIWETLDTAEATYIWRSEKNKPALKATLNEIEHILNLIRVQGKIAYINSGHENMKRIFHNYSEIKNGFISWKSELDSLLV